MIVVAGKNNIAVHALEYLASLLGEDCLVAVPNKNDSGEDSWQRSLSLAAVNNNVPLVNYEELDKEEVDIFLSLEFDRIINPDQFSRARLYNIHFSKLPAYKGMYTAVWPILNGDSTAGVTLHEIDAGIDTGDIVSQIVFDVSPSDRSRDLYRKFIDSSIDLFSNCIRDILSGSLETRPQPSIGSTYFSKDSIDFSKSFINAKCTAWELKKYIYAYSFREYQLPIFRGESIVEVEITPEKSIFPAGSVVEKSEHLIKISTVDYDAVLYFDRLNYVLSKMGKCSSAEAGELVKNISGVHDRNNSGWSPIIVAAYNGNLEVVDFLLGKGASPNDCNYKGTTVLMYAKDYCLRSGCRELFDILVQYGADPYASDYSGKQLVDYVTPEECAFLGL